MGRNIDSNIVRKVCVRYNSYGIPTHQYSLGHIYKKYYTSYIDSAFITLKYVIRSKQTFS